ncbi:MAG: hypothetical protein JXI43_10985 [Tissierellales bacterium]|nr:hypothetical protein [Tissierellales bacterium]
MKNRHLSLMLILFTNSLLSQTGPAFEDHFINKTLRMDYVHAGTAVEEWYAYNELYQEPVWAGSMTNLVDTLNLGKYIFEVRDTQTDELLYSRGFCSIFGEWETTQEAIDGIQRSFSESVRFPWPKRTVTIIISSRDQYNDFQEDWVFTIDPAEPNIRKNIFYPNAKVTGVIDNGDPNQKVDIVMLPDGYTADEMDKFLKDTKRHLDILFSTSPFKERKKDFNVWAVEIPSNMTGIDDPQSNRYVDNVLSCSFNSFRTDRYILTWDNVTLRKVAALAPYDQIIVLINDSKYGGGGIFNLYSTCIADNEWSGYIFVHELGHAFGGLADEYYTSDVAYSEFYPLNVEPWEPNITVLLDENHVKWQELIEPATPVPTPWDKETYDRHQTEYNRLRLELRDKHVSQSKLDSLTAVNDQWVNQFLRNQAYWGKVGAFEGAGYASEGIYRPYLDCRMFTRSMTGFDPVCRRSIEKAIDFYTQ